ncbi:hypothetical protein J2S43_008409 [Catenuloplanes nepalensis]|uniref:Uncharacterized protein n=1 Tax=Catenuloplanes nepalensis TaxID=587533 RepID=A0ABT9N855_9ACTN|nr:hypothetical protein [Catenuloplanes nepalensis]MDP9799897.1 hypothetical protein [Catenuloplanes nepalensis]
MQNLRRRMLTPVLAATVAIAPALGLAAPASAAPAAPAGLVFAQEAADEPDWHPASVSVTTAKISKTAFTLKSSEGCANRAHITATLSGPLPTENVLVSAVGVDIRRNGAIYDATLLTNTRGNVWEGDLLVCGKDPAGTYSTELYGAYVTGTGVNDPNLTYYRTNVTTGRYTVKRPASVTLNAAPEPVRKGTKLTAKGVFSTDGRAAANTKVQIWFKADGASAWSRQATVTTNAKGAYGRTFKATTSGTWKAVVPATGSRNEVVAYDAVRVRK